MAKKALSHVDKAGRPAMVDVSGKAETARAAKAECLVRFPSAVGKQLQADGMRTAKGAVLDTAMRHRPSGAEAVELIMWLTMRGALSKSAKKVHRHYYAPMTTGMGLISFEDA